MDATVREREREIEIESKKERERVDRGRDGASAGALRDGKVGLVQEHLYRLCRGGRHLFGVAT